MESETKLLFESDLENLLLCRPFHFSQSIRSCFHSLRCQRLHQLRGNRLCGGTSAIGDAYKTIAYGDGVDVMITGGVEAAITPLAVAGFCAMRALSTRNDELR